MPALTPQLEWLPFLHKHNDAHLLDQWHTAKPTYQRGDEYNGLAWKHDRHEHLLIEKADPKLFAHAADGVWRYNFYPSNVMHHRSHAARANRWLREGDLIVQRIHGLGGLFDALTANRVSEVIDEPRRKGLAYVTTQAHFEVGEWWCWVEWQTGGALVVNLRSVSRPGPRLPRWQRPYARWLQRQAHRAGLAHFSQWVLAG